MRILLTGEKGYIGTRLAQWLSGKANIAAVRRLSLRDETWESRDFSGIDGIVHLAALVHRKEKPEHEADYYRINTALTKSLGEKAKLAGVRQFVFLSSMAVYGLAGEALLPGKEGLGGTQITGGTQPEPNTLYGKSKLAAEQALQALAAPSFLVSVLRPPLVYGPGCPGNYRRLRRLALGAPVFPALANQRSMIYIDHLCELIYLVLQQQAPGLFLPQNRAYVSTAGMAEAIAGRHGRKLNKKAWLNPWLKGLAGWTPAIPKAFGSLVYARELSGCFDWSYCMYSFEETMARTEGAPQ